MFIINVKIAQFERRRFAICRLSCNSIPSIETIKQMVMKVLHDQCICRLVWSDTIYTRYRLLVSTLSFKTDNHDYTGYVPWVTSGCPSQCCIMISCYTVLCISNWIVSEQCYSWFNLDLGYVVNIYDKGHFWYVTLHTKRAFEHMRTV